MSRRRIATLALAAALIAATPALADNGGSKPVTGKTLRTGQLCPNYQFVARDPRTTARGATTRSIPWSEALLVEELGPKYLLGR